MHLQLSVLVWDDARPENTATSTLTCVMMRNEHAPRFVQDDYRVTINDRYQQGDNVLTLSATDNDNVRTLVTADTCFTSLNVLNTAT